MPFAYVVAAIHNLCLDRFAEAADALQRAAERKLEIPEFLVTRYYLAFLKGDQAGMEREIARAPRRARGGLDVAQSGAGARPFRTNAAGADHVGARDRVGAAGRQARESRDLRGRGGGVRSAFRECGRGEEARSGGTGTWQKAAMWSMPRRLRWRSPAILPESQRLAADLEKRFPEDTPVQFEYLPTLRALSALAHQAPLDAIERLQTALPYDFAMPGTAFFAKFGGLYPAYVRGQAYLAAGRARRPRRNSKKSSITAASFSPIRSAPWRTCNWAEHTLSRAT